MRKKAKPEKLKKLKTGWRGHEDEYSYGEKEYVTSRHRRGFTIYERGKLLQSEAVFSSPGLTTYGYFIKLFKIFLAENLPV